MGAAKKLRSYSKPYLSQASSIPSKVKQPVYVVEESGDEFQIVINMSGAAKTDLQIYTSKDGERMYVTGEKFYHDSIERFLWTFDVPKSIDSQMIAVDQKKDFYLIHIPKIKFWDRLGNPFSRPIPYATGIR